MSPFCRPAVAAVLAAVLCPVNAIAQEEQTTMQATEAGELTFERVFASPSLGGPAPRLMKLSPDGRYLTLLRNREDEKDRYDLWAFDRQDGEWRMLVDSGKLGSGRELSEEEKMRREGTDDR